MKKNRFLVAAILFAAVCTTTLVSCKKDKNAEPQAPAPNPVVTYMLTALSNDEEMGTVTGGGTYSEGSRVNVTATPKSGYQFDKWSDGNTSASRTINVTQNLSLTAQFKAVTSGGSNDDDEDPAFI